MLDNLINIVHIHSNTTLVKVKSFIVKYSLFLVLIQIQHLLKLNKMA
nr:MAG TPA: hypothetical protein [Caudoviricetes sp.]